MSIVSENLLENDKGHNDQPTFQQVLKLELGQLQKDYRLLETARHGFAQKDGCLRMRTKKLLPVLERDRLELNYELRNATCRLHIRKAENLAFTMKEALRTFDVYQLEIGKKLKQVHEIEKHVDKITDKVIKQKFKMLALHGLNKTQAQRESDLEKMENRLYHSTCEFNLQIHANRKIRAAIMDLLDGRSRFFKTHNGIKKQLSRAKQKMLETVQLANHTYDTRDEAMSKVKALRERETKEVKLHRMELQEFERTLHHDQKLLTFISTKLKNRPVIEDAKSRRMRLGLSKEKELDTILRRYRRSFKRILEYAKTSSIMDLVESYQQVDLENFAVFKYITNLNSECEVLKDASQILQTKIESSHLEVQKRAKSQKSAQEKLQLLIMTKQERLSAMEKQNGRNKVNLSNLTKAIGAIFRLAECPTSPIMRLLGNKQGITINNIRLCLEQLDYKITEMKHERDRLQAIKTPKNMTNAFKPSSLAKTKVQSHGGPFFPKVIIGGMLNADSMEDEDSKLMEQGPYYYKDMREYLYERMIADKVIDISLRSVTTFKLPPAEPEPQKEVGETMSLLQKSHNQYPHGHKKHTSGDGIQTGRTSLSSGGKENIPATVVESTAPVLHRKSRSIINLGKQLQTVLARDDTHPYPQDFENVEFGDPALGKEHKMFRRKTRSKSVRVIIDDNEKSLNAHPDRNRRDTDQSQSDPLNPFMTNLHNAEVAEHERERQEHLQNGFSESQHETHKENK